MWWPACIGLTVGAADPVAHVQGYASYGAPSWFVLKGRVLAGPAPLPPDPTQSRLASLLDTWRLAESDEIAGATVTAFVAGHTYRTVSDADGLFVISAHQMTPPSAPGRHDIEVRAQFAEAAATGKAELYIFPEQPGLAVVSDIDDTVVESRVTNWLQMVTIVATRNAAQRKATPGMSAAYRAAQVAGATGFFYVSSSPQNLYSRLRAFLDLAGYPAGPLLLKNLGEDTIADHATYKTKRIETLLAAYPHLRFVLIGDSGERDPEIYRAIRAAYPERIAAIVIREVAGRTLVAADDLRLLRADGSNAHLIGEVVAAQRDPK